MDKEEKLTASEAGELLGVSAQTVRRLIRDRKLRALRVGAKFLIANSEIERFMSAHTTC